MKKILSYLMSFVLLFSMSFNQVFANTELNSPKDIIVIQNTSSSEEFIVPNSKLIGTDLEDKTVIVTTDTVLIDGRDVAVGPSGAAIAIFIGGIIAGYLIDGVILYVTGYTGAELTNIAIQSLVNACNSFRNMVQAYFSSPSSRLQSFRLSNGNECVLSPSGSNYICKF